jgi:hypothetical protein
VVEPTGFTSDESGQKARGYFVSNLRYRTEVEISVFGFPIKSGGSDEELAGVWQSANKFQSA